MTSALGNLPILREFIAGRKAMMQHDRIVMRLLETTTATAAVLGTVASYKTGTALPACIALDIGLVYVPLAILIGHERLQTPKP